jgi:signal transduction histidine kinase
MNESQTEYLWIVRSSADHLLLLINDALDLATVEAGQLTLRPEAIDPALVARECVEAVRGLADARDVRVAFAAEDRGRVSLDPGRLRQVILNLLSNAIKFSAAGGQVTVRLAREDGRLTIAVSDEGIGIPAADLERVFDEFVQLGDGDRAGSGLGLAVTRQIVQAQGGEVGVWSRAGAGSTFTAWLPWRTPEVSRPVQADGDASRAWRSRPRIPSSQRSG